MRPVSERTARGPQGTEPRSPLSQSEGLLLLAVIGYAAFALIGLGRVPFHPDETSLLFQSRDLELILRDPGRLTWSRDQPLGNQQRYRALNAPLPKYVLGAGRLLGGYSAGAIEADWDWTESWSQNLERGALPSDGLLLAARRASAILLPLALLLTYLVGRQLGGTAAGALAAGLLGFNGLFLLHGRRAMMEGTLFFGMCLALWAMVRADRRPWLVGLAVGLALAAKHSLLPLFPLGVLAVLWTSEPTHPLRSRMQNLAQYLAVTALVFALLNPFLWADPWAAGAAILEQRSSLVSDQLQTQVQADHVAMQLPMGASDRLAAFLGQVFFAPVQFLEAANYRAETSSEVAAYLQFPGHNWLRGWLAGGVTLGLSLLGAIRAALSLPRLPSPDRRRSSLLLLGTLAMGLTLLIGIPFPFQRYYVPMLPFVSLWSACALAHTCSTMKRLLSSRAAHR